MGKLFTTQSPPPAPIPIPTLPPLPKVKTPKKVESEEDLRSRARRGLASTIATSSRGVRQSGRLTSADSDFYGKNLLGE